MEEAINRYYQAMEVDEQNVNQLKTAGMTLYTASGRYYSLSWGHSISAPGPNGTTLWNEEIDGVVAAYSDEEAAAKLGIARY